MSFSTFEGGRPRAVGRGTTGGSDDLTLVVPPSWARTLVITFEGATGKLVHDGDLGDTDPIGAAAYESLPADTPIPIPITEGRDPSDQAPVLITSATAGATFSIVAEARE